MIKTSRDIVNKMVEDKINDCITWQQMHKVTNPKSSTIKTSTLLRPSSSCPNQLVSM